MTGRTHSGPAFHGPPYADALADSPGASAVRTCNARCFQRYKRSITVSHDSYW